MPTHHLKRETFSRIVEHYASPTVYTDTMKRAIEVGRKIVEAVPSIVSVYGLGYPFYGDYDVIERINHGIMLGKRDTSLLPDIDLLIVYDGREFPKYLNDDFSRKVFDDFGKVVSEGGHWSRLYTDLINNHKIADRNNDLEDEFSKGRIHIDITPVPLDFWKDVPYLFKPGDLNNWKKLERDILFTAEHIATKHMYGEHKSVPSDFIKHRMLWHISKKGMSQEELIDTFIENHPYKDLMHEFKEIHNFQTSKLKSILDDLKKKRLINEEEGKLRLTDTGSNYLDNIMKKRKKVLDEWMLSEK